MNYKVLSTIEPKPGRVAAFQKEHPVIMKFIEPALHLIDGFVEKELEINLDRLETIAHPQEDHLFYSKKFPIFCVADGVTLELSLDGTYPNPSPAGELARIISESFVAEAEKRYESFTEASLLSVFRIVNEKAAEHNKSYGRTKGKINFWDFDLFSATMAFVLIKDYELYWATICDSRVSVFDKNGKIKFLSPDCWPSDRQKRCLPANWSSFQGKEKQIIIREKYRNGLDAEGKPIGYGVVTGEIAAEKYLNTGSLSLSSWDLVVLYSDGFENYFKLPDFISLLLRFSPKLEEDISLYTAKKSKEDGARFGHERSLIAVSIA